MSPGNQLTPPQPTVPTNEPPREFTVREGERVSETVIRAIAEQDDVSLTDIVPLYERIDPDALDDFFEPTYDGRPSTATSVEFEYGGYTVVVRGYGIVELH
ncbi:HalOD1 output domain-containing protein (plasmid) [Haladaptatus sp. SPP-AMP-3]|uniref:HalOD1 output domain-containing protein n=1 Tax=Haladaptatus sp. SPP-AMP-3 TaxID=3121295 RepID=UPI003C2E7C85